MNLLIHDDAKNVIQGLGDLVHRFEGARVLITGHQGFLGANFLAFFHILNQEVLTRKASITCIDNGIVPLEDQTQEFIRECDVRYGDVLSILNDDEPYDYVIHCAGIASPTYYRQHPLETIEVNAISYWHLLNGLNTSKLKGFLYFSTSEIYGDPAPEYIPTPEDYRGNVSCTGPRACYDESKRLGETISVSFVQEKGLPIKIARPFNVYGPLMRLNDKRVVPDFVKFALEEQTIKIFSDGTPTRAFCYVSDAVEGFLRALLLGTPGRPYNIGNDTTETSMRQLAETIAGILGDVQVSLASSSEKNYLTDNPQRRCPVLTRARTDLRYEPKITVQKGLTRTIQWYRQTYQLGTVADTSMV